MGDFNGGYAHTETLTPILTLFLKLCNSFLFIFNFSLLYIRFYILVLIISNNILVLIKSAPARDTNYLCKCQVFVFIHIYI